MAEQEEYKEKFAPIYHSNEQVHRYDALIAAEDWEGNILECLRRVVQIPESAVVVDMGAGTGRLSVLLHPICSQLYLYDIAEEMLQVAERKLAAGKGNAPYEAHVADNRTIPRPDSSADLVIEGWSFGHMGVEDALQAVREMERVSRGHCVILETKTTASRVPLPPSPTLAKLYDRLEGEMGYASCDIRTDYRFKSRQEAEQLVSFFFGAEMAKQALDILRPDFVLPECTGVW
eukprot:CAMPEP_0119142692 /NCGR_PEP_ID=MMETSP1310-20130426/33093_1 /TAXON_ID=464262 /ORGANISM="Genus nov. species nov., Strain RCC2339" /LENGTH=232 /DNA_ID=CAMNT_0007134251 /DNA_START=81 /DNA_END=776 /DNA_ORIENTATION=+